MPDAKLWFTARAGAALAAYGPEGLLLGIIETHPEHPPVMHWLDGRHETLQCGADGTPALASSEAVTLRT